MAVFSTGTPYYGAKQNATIAICTVPDASGELLRRPCSAGVLSLPGEGPGGEPLEVREPGGTLGDEGAEADPHGEEEEDRVDEGAEHRRPPRPAVAEEGRLDDGPCPSERVRPGGGWGGGARPMNSGTGASPS